MKTSTCFRTKTWRGLSTASSCLLDRRTIGEGDGATGVAVAHSEVLLALRLDVLLSSRGFLGAGRSEGLRLRVASPSTEIFLTFVPLLGRFCVSFFAVSDTMEETETRAPFAWYKIEVLVSTLARIFPEVGESSTCRLDSVGINNET